MFRNVVEVGVIVLLVHFCTTALALRTHHHGNHYVGQLAAEHFRNLFGIY